MLCGDWPGYIEDCVFDNELTVFVRLYRFGGGVLLYIRNHLS